jgi:DNA-binding transcriptional LysR family regulator
VDLRQLRYFTVLADTLNFHRAAERLHMSQPPLTVAIRKLEEDLGAELFERDPRGIRLTAAGMAALPAARAAIAQAELVREFARQGAQGVRGRLAVGFIGSAVSELLPRIVTPFRAAFPAVSLALEEMNSVDIMNAIEARRIDVGLVRLPLTDLPPGVRDIPLASLADRPFIIHSPVSVLNAAIRLACHRAGFTPNVSQEAIQVQTILGLVQAGLGVALVPSRIGRFAPDGVRLIPLTEPIPIESGIAIAADAGPIARNFAAAALASDDSL